MDKLFLLFKILDFEILCVPDDNHMVLDYAYGKIVNGDEEYRFEIVKNSTEDIHFYFIKKHETKYRNTYNILDVIEFIKSEFKKELREYKIKKLLSDEL